VLGLQQIYETSDKGNSWHAISPALDGSQSVSALAYAPGNDQVIYAAFSDGKVFVTTNQGGDGSAANWTEIDHGNSWGGGVSHLLTDPVNSAVAYLTTNSGVYVPGRLWRTVNGGASWLDITGNLPGVAVNGGVVYHAPLAASSTIFLATDVGVYASYKQGTNTHWARYGVGLPPVRVTDLQFDAGTNHLLAATWGRGAWEIAVPKVLSQFKGDTGLAGYYTDSDGYQHAIVATSDGVVHEVFFNPAAGIGEDDLAQYAAGSIVAVAGYFTPDGYQHAIVATSDGQVHEIFFNPDQGLGQDVLATFAAGSIVKLAGYFTPEDGYQHVIVATIDGVVHEVFFSPTQGLGQDVLAQYAAGTVVSLAGYVTPQDGFNNGDYQHVIVATSDGVVHEIFFNPTLGLGQDVLAQYAAGSIASLAGYYTPGDGYQHVIVATSDGKVHEVFFNPNVGTFQDVLAQFSNSAIIGVAGYITPVDSTPAHDFQDVLVATADGLIEQIRWRPDVGF
jgi:2-keto-3-deoxy-6-phosphogluconate aldolase